MSFWRVADWCACSLKSVAWSLLLGLAPSSPGAIRCWTAGFVPFQCWLQNLLTCAWKIESVPPCVIHQKFFYRKISFRCSSCSSDSSFHYLVPLENSWDALFSQFGALYRTFFMADFFLLLFAISVIFVIMISIAEASVISQACIFFSIWSVRKFLDLDQRGGGCPG